MFCPAALPVSGDKVDIVGVGEATVLSSQPALQSGLYGKAGLQPLPPGFDGGCTLQVQYADGRTDTVSAARAPKSEVGEFMDTWGELVLLGGLYGGPLFLDSLSGNAYDDFKKRYEARLRENYGAPAPFAPPNELSGEYWGASEESDEGDQAVRVTLRFGANGKLSGRGRDGVDGSYKIADGRWSVDEDGVTRMFWKEVYDEGFDAICIGELDAKTGKIEGRFESSRNVGGSFELAKRPSIF